MSWQSESPIRWQGYLLALQSMFTCPQFPWVSGQYAFSSIWYIYIYYQVWIIHTHTTVTHLKQNEAQSADAKSPTLWRSHYTDCAAPVTSMSVDKCWEWEEMNGSIKQYFKNPKKQKFSDQHTRELISARKTSHTFEDTYMFLWWSLCTLYKLHACQVRVTIGNSDICCCTCVTSFKR